MPETNSSNNPSFVDGTSSGLPMPATETTAPSGNLASVMRNWIVVTPPAPSQPEAKPPITREA